MVRGFRAATRSLHLSGFSVRFRRFFAPSAAVALATLVSLASAGCNDIEDPFAQVPIASDTVSLAIPSERAPFGSALDIVANDTFRIGGVRRPERQGDAALGWDVVLRRSANRSDLELRPAGATGLESRAGIFRSEQSFNEIERAPSGSRFSTDSAAVLRLGTAYVIRSRSLGGGCGVKYAKLEPLALDAAAGTVRLRVESNARCGDTRLSRDD